MCHWSLCFSSRIPQLWSCSIFASTSQGLVRKSQEPGLAPYCPQAQAGEALPGPCAQKSNPGSSPAALHGPTLSAGTSRARSRRLRDVPSWALHGLLPCYASSTSDPQSPCPNSIQLAANRLARSLAVTPPLSPGLMCRGGAGPQA